MKLALIGLLSTLCALIPVAEDWHADASKAKISFIVDGPFGKVHGDFTGLKSSFKFDDKDLGGSRLTASVDPNTVNSGNSLRNRHLRNEEQWLDTKKYPEIKFTSRKFSKAANGYILSGDLTLKGISKSILIPFTFSTTGSTAIFKGHFSFARKDFQLGKDGGSVGNRIEIGLEVPVSK